MDTQNVLAEFEICSFSRSCDNRGYPKNWAVTGYAHAPFSPKFLMGFCSDGSLANPLADTMNITEKHILALEHP